MVKLRIICIGKLKERFYADAVKELVKRISRYAVLEIVELEDEKSPERLSSAELAQLKRVEGRRIEERLMANEWVVALDINGRQLSSVELASTVSAWMVDGRSRIALLIGGSNGLSDELISRADYRLSFSRMTFSHQLFRIMLLEQLYRAFKLISGEPYHK